MRIRFSISDYDYGSIIEWFGKSLEKKKQKNLLFIVDQWILDNLKKISDGKKDFIILKASSVKKINQTILKKINKEMKKNELSAYFDDLTLEKNGDSLIFDATIVNLNLIEIFTFLSKKFDKNEVQLMREVISPGLIVLSEYFVRITNELFISAERQRQYQEEFFTEILSATAQGLKNFLPEFLNERFGIILKVDKILIDTKS